MEPRYRFLDAKLVSLQPLTVWYNAVFYLSNGEKRLNGTPSGFSGSGGYLLSANDAHVMARARELLERAAGLLAGGADASAELEEAVHLDCLRVLAWHEDSLSRLPPELAFGRLDFAKLVPLREARLIKEA